MVPKSFGVQMLQQLFELEMCMRETKNRMHTPLSQLPLHCLWDCLCVSPLSSFRPLALGGCCYPSPLCFPTFPSPWIRPCVSGQSCAGMKDLKRDTASPHYGPLSSLMGNWNTVAQNVKLLSLLDPIIWEANRSLYQSQNKEDLLVRNDENNINKCAFEKDPRKMPNSFVFQGWRDIKHALVQLELCLCSLFLPNNKKKACFHLNRETFNLASDNGHFGRDHV